MGSISSVPEDRKSSVTSVQEDRRASVSSTQETKKDSIDDRRLSVASIDGGRKLSVTSQQGERRISEGSIKGDVSIGSKTSSRKASIEDVKNGVHSENNTHEDSVAVSEPKCEEKLYEKRGNGVEEEEEGSDEKLSPPCKESGEEPQNTGKDGVSTNENDGDQISSPCKEADENE